MKSILIFIFIKISKKLLEKKWYVTLNFRYERHVQENIKLTTERYQNTL